MTHEEFIAAVAEYVREYAPEYGILVHSPIIAQAILESGWGKSKLSSAPYWNFFGLKCGSKWTGRSVNMATKEEYSAGCVTDIRANFRAYDSMPLGIKGYFEFLQYSRYANLKGITDPLEYLKTIKADGYATSSTYVDDNYKVIQQYNLTQYDDQEGCESTMAVKIGSARSSYGNTTRGDQHSGLEVSTQNWYLHSKGWRVFRAIDADKQKKLAYACQAACNNNKIGYSQPDRLALKTHLESMSPVTYDPATVTQATNCDCSSLVRVCCFYAGIKPTNFITSNEASALLATGEFKELTDTKYTTKSDYLRAGDVLVTKTKGHTVIVLTSGAKASSDTGSASTTYNLGDRVLSNGCTGADVKELQTLLINAGYDCGSWGADGEFGDATELAVSAFQKAQNLTTDGKVTAAVIEKLYEVNGNEDKTTGKYVSINGGNCYIRVEPNTSATKLGVAYKGSTYAYGGDTSLSGWIKIKTQSLGDGWVSGKYGKLEE